AISGPSPTGHARTERSSASTRRWRASGPTGSATAHIDNATRRCHTGSTTTTREGRTAHSATGHRSAAFTTSVGRTASDCLPGVAVLAVAAHVLRSQRVVRHFLGSLFLGERLDVHSCVG